jgi:branched-chain amino acid transport system permease protein
MSRRRLSVPLRFALAAGAWIALALATRFLDEYLLTVVSLIAVYSVFAVGYNLLLGYAGQFDFGQAAFLAIGAYGTAILTAKVGLPFGAALPLAALIAVAAGLLIGIIVLRISGIYLALVTLGFNQAVVLAIALAGPVTGGFQGLSVPAPRIAGLPTELTNYWITTGCATLLVLAAVNVLDSRIGLAFRALRESDIAAEAMGVDLIRYRVTAYGLSAFYGGIAGGLLSIVLSYITPEGFGLGETLKVLTMITVGGMGSVMGSVVGAAALTASGELLRFSSVSQEVSNGVLLMLFIMLMPRGIVGVIARLVRPRPKPAVLRGADGAA